MSARPDRALRRRADRADREADLAELLAQAVPVELLRRTWPVLLPNEATAVEDFPVRRMLIETVRHRGVATCGAYLIDSPDPEVVRGRFLGRDPAPGLVVAGGGPLLGCEEFLDRRAWPALYKSRFGGVVWNAAEVFSSLAFSSEPHKGGMRLHLWTYLVADGVRRPSRYRCPVDLAPHANGRVIVTLASRKDPDPADLHHGKRWRGRILDLRDPVATLVGERVDDLSDACRLFECATIPPPGQATPETIAVRLDATAELLHAVEREAAEWPGAPYLALDRTGSSAVLPVAVLRAARVPEPLRRRGGPTMRVPLRAIGAGAEAAGIGARGGTFVRRQRVRGYDLDEVRQYVVANALAGAERFLTHEVTAHHLSGRRALEGLRRAVADFVAAGPLENPGDWRSVAFLAKVRPGGETWTVHVGGWEAEATVTVPVTLGSVPFWTTGYDVASALIEDDLLAELEEAWVFEFGRRLRGLRAVALPGGFTFDPRRDGASRDGTTFGHLGLAFAALDQSTKLDASLSAAGRLRRRGSLKVGGNSVAFGLYLATTPEPRARSKDGLHGVLTAGGIRRVAGAPERPGPYAFPPAAALVQGSGRLLLGLLMREARASGFDVAAADTDGCFVFEAPDGGDAA